MIKKIFIITALAVSGLIFNIQAQEFAPVGTAVAQFLEIGMGARSTAMGEAYTTLGSDASAVFWNPAGIVEVEGRNFFLAYNRWPADIALGGVSFVWNLGAVGVIGINSVFLNTADMEVTTVDDPDGLSGEKFGISNYTLGLTYARYFTNRLSVGATVKLVHEKYLEYGYDSWAVDIGTVYRTAFRNLKIGMSILHFGKEVQFSGNYYDYSDPELLQGETKTFEKYSLPVNFRVGFSIDIWESGLNKIITAADMVHPNNNLEQYNWGLEYGFNNMFFLRGGYKFRADEGGLTLGAGIQYNLTPQTGVAFDYSFAEMGVIPAVHRLSAGFTF